MAKSFVYEKCVETIKGMVKPAKQMSLFDQVEFVRNFCCSKDRIIATGGNVAT